MRKLVRDVLREELTSGDSATRKLLTELLLSIVPKDSTGAELSSYVKNLDVLLSSRASESTLSAVKSKTDNLDVALSTRASESTLSAIKSKTDNLDIALSALRDALKPARSPVTQDLSNYSLAGGGSVNIDKTGLDGWSALVAIVRVSYNASATAGVRVRWLYSPDGSNYDSPEDADAQGNYYDPSFTAGATRQATLLIPILAPYVRVQIANKDSTYAHTLSTWTLTLR